MLVHFSVRNQNYKTKKFRDQITYKVQVLTILIFLYTHKHKYVHMYTTCMLESTFRASPIQWKISVSMLNFSIWVRKSFSNAMLFFMSNLLYIILGDKFVTEYSIRQILAFDCYWLLCFNFSFNYCNFCIFKFFKTKIRFIFVTYKTFMIWTKSRFSIWNSITRWNT